MSQQQCEIQLGQLIKQTRVLSAELEGIRIQRRAMRQLLHSQRPQGCVMNRSDLFAMQRRQAVLRRQLQMLSFQENKVQEQEQALQKEKEQVLLLRRYWLHKQNKYEHWQKIQWQVWRLYQLRQEESEAEERVTWSQS
ncbi:type III needle complex assembly protein [Iodobacter ciconiae]|nr:type III needle complex assembly protein [Iodobacter ciconiae]